MSILSENIENYIAQHSRQADAVLQSLDRATHLTQMMPQMMSNASQGAFLYLLAALVQARKVLEVGTFSGYASLWLAKALPKDGFIHTIDINEELQDMHQKFFAESEVGDRIICHYGNAKDIIPRLEVSFDLAFIDADKQAYLDYYRLILPKIRKNGIILADNVLWKGKVADNSVQDKDTQAIRAFNAFVQADDKVENTILSIRDGIMLIRKL
ncbi:MAG: O-methyltransferase [Chitinophagales bacterium]|nr:O-methyltransferase [Bacteroidota bacterium]MCB9043120.1 O-methyltransferase [Chitinophagales bacterium]